MFEGRVSWCSRSILSLAYWSGKKLWFSTFLGVVTPVRDLKN